MTTQQTTRPSGYSRRDFFRCTITATLIGGVAAVICKPRSAFGADTGGYQGDLVIVSAQGAAPDKALPGQLDRFKSNGVNPKVVFYPAEKFVALYTAAQAAGEQVDVLMLNGQDLRRYATAEALLSLDQIAYKDRFLKEALPPLTVNGHLWGVPAGGAGGFPIFSNQAILKKYQLTAPENYDQLKEVGKVLVKNGLYPFTHPGKVIYMWPVWFFTTFARTSQNRSAERTEEILTGKGKFTDADVVEALDILSRFSEDKMFAPDVFSLDFPNALTEFATGKAAFFLFHDSMAQQIRDTNPPGMELDMMLMPSLTAQKAESQYPGGFGAVLAIPAKVDPKRKEAALALIDYLSSDANNAEAIKLNGGAIPVNINVPPVDVPVYAKEKQVINRMVVYLDWSWPPEITRTFQEGLQSVVAGRMSGKALAAKAQSTLERLVSNGYKFGA